MRIVALCILASVFLVSGLVGANEPNGNIEFFLGRAVIKYDPDKNSNILVLDEYKRAHQLTVPLDGAFEINTIVWLGLERTSVSCSKTVKTCTVFVLSDRSKVFWDDAVEKFNHPVDVLPVVEN